MQDSVGNYYDCRLTLTTAVVSAGSKVDRKIDATLHTAIFESVQDPVCTPDGIIYSREAILESLLEQKKTNKRKFAAWKAEQDEELQKVALQTPFFLVSY